VLYTDFQRKIKPVEGYEAGQMKIDDGTGRKGNAIRSYLTGTAAGNMVTGAVSKSWVLQ
jgi:hypothetical protein